jgi:hypothetical protein
MKSYATFRDYSADQSPANQRILAAVREFVKATAPKLVESVKWGNGCWLKGKVPVAYVYAEPAGLQFGFMVGSLLKDPRGLLQGKGQYVRHLKLGRPEDVDARILAPFLRQAIRETPERMSDLGAGKKKTGARKTPKKKARKAR